MNQECKFQIGDRVKLSKEALKYAKSPTDLQRWKKDRGEVRSSEWWEGHDQEGNSLQMWLIKVDFTDDYLKHINFLENQLKKSKD